MLNLVLPLHDPNYLIIPHLIKTTPLLKKYFNKTFLSISHQTYFKFPKELSFFYNDNFYITKNIDNSYAGNNHFSVFNLGINYSKETDILHLCDPDRLLFAIEKFPKKFFKDMNKSKKLKKPIQYIRSKKAWKTHPQNYFAIESMATKLGEILFNKTLDFAWCHLALKASDLKRILHFVNKTEDLSLIGEIAYYLKDKIQTKKVDWLSWEDPFILEKDPQKLKTEREKSKQENQKRLSYIIPIINFLLNKSCQ